MTTATTLRRSTRRVFTLLSLALLLGAFSTAQAQQVCVGGACQGTGLSSQQTATVVVPTLAYLNVTSGETFGADLSSLSLDASNFLSTGDGYVRVNGVGSTVFDLYCNFQPLVNVGISWTQGVEGSVDIIANYGGQSSVLTSNTGLSLNGLNKGLNLNKTVNYDVRVPLNTDIATYGASINLTVTAP